MISNLPRTSKSYLAFCNLSIVSLAVMLMLLIVVFQVIPIKVYSQLPFVPSSPSTSSGSNNSTATTTTNTQSSLITSSSTSKEKQQ